MKVLLLSVDGMRPDAIADLPEVRRLMAKASYTLHAKTVFPSVTLPCHVSMFHSVDPGRHGTTTNTYAPQVRPVPGICEVVHAAKKRSAFLYQWNELRDLFRPGHVDFEHFVNPGFFGDAEAVTMSADMAIHMLHKYDFDFTFLYYHYTDAAGHGHGWMSPEYMEAMRCSWREIERVLDSLSDEYTVLVTADHGGHDRSHGSDLPEDMTIPLFARGRDFAPGRELSDVSILDVAPTVVKLLGLEPAEEWEGKSLF